VAENQYNKHTGNEKGRFNMKIGIEIKIDVTKIDKERIHVGQKGKYIDLTTFIDTEKEGRYGDHGFISQKVSKEEREQGIQTPILGNCRVFYVDEGSGQGQQGRQQQQPQNQGGYAPPAYDDDGSIPF
jgi:hypothetical protein